LAGPAHQRLHGAVRDRGAAPEGELGVDPPSAVHASRGAMCTTPMISVRNASRGERAEAERFFHR
jgi:hypothetical protein